MHREGGGTYCVKIFKKGWSTPFNLEKTAYAYLKKAKLEEYVPDVYGFDRRTLSAWGLRGLDHDTTKYDGIVMEWIENSEAVSPENITFGHAWLLLEGLRKIHAAGIVHNDPYRRNVLVIPGTETAKWIDFSCAHVTRGPHMADEMRSATSMILECVPSIFKCLLRYSCLRAADDGGRDK
jgi:predicted Ser/Thr protein kinase